MQKKTRRGFLKTSSAASLGVTVLPESVTILKKGRIAGANDRIRIGFIGCGNNSVGNMKLLYESARENNIDMEIVALCDTWRVAREETNALIRSWYGRDASLHVSYRELLSLKHVDAVYIGTPDHLHTLHLEASAQAGKHIYVQKPVAMEMDKLVRAYDAVKAAGVVVQTGTQIRSTPGIFGAREAYKNGLLGKLSRIEECRNSSKPYWYRYLRDVKKEDVDWKEFLNDRRSRPFSSDQYSAWYGYYDFSHGPITNLGAHFIDTVHFITGAKFPESCVCLGSIFTWKDEHNFTVPDCVQATWIYPEGFLVSSSNNTANSSGSVRNLYGDKAMLNISDPRNPVISDRGAPNPDGSIKGEKPVTPVDCPLHHLDWLQCMLNGRTPNASIEAGYQHSVAVLMAVRSFETGRKTVYDHKKRVKNTV